MASRLRQVGDCTRLVNDAPIWARTPGGSRCGPGRRSHAESSDKRPARRETVERLARRVYVAPMNEHPVSVAVRRPDGSVEQVRVGTAYPEGDGFRLELGELRIGAAQAARSSSTSSYSSSSARAPAPGGDDGGMRLPNYGKSKNAPVFGASEQDLEYYANGARRSLNDPSKSRWHDKERALLAAIEAELARQRAGGGSQLQTTSDYGDGEPPPPTDEDAPF